MRRRHLLALAGGLSFPAHGQQLPRVGFLVAGDAEPSWTLFRAAMADLGYVEGRSVVFEYDDAGVNRGLVDRLAASLVERPVDVIVAVLSQAIVAAKNATQRIPIVFFGAAPDIGGVSNIARPEANLTGIFNPSSTVAGKGLQLFHEIRPTTKAFGLLLNSLDPFHVPLQRDVEATARAEKIETLPVLIKTRDELPAAFETMARAGVDGVLVQPSLGFEGPAELALKHRLPAISFRREFAEAGGLLTYGAIQADNMRAVATYVDRILKGARPADLPVQQASRFELIVNQKTARTLGIVIPPMFLARVDEVIE
jgi:putative ABC transport system substrate-binding protein